MITESDVQGHWQRHWIKAPGFEDHTTRVHWIQAGLDYADVRVPQERPDVSGARCLAELPASSLHALARAEGFAGRVEITDDTCTWHREINWHGAPEAPDVGQISFDQDGRMIEAGVLEDYTELWEQRAETETTALRFSDGDYSGILITCGKVGVLGIGQPGKPASKPIVDALETGQIPRGIDRFFDGLHALCDIDNDHVVATLATDPWAEGQTVLTLLDGSVIWHRIGFDGSRTEINIRKETAVRSSGF